MVMWFQISYNEPMNLNWSVTPMEEEETRRQGVPLGRRFYALYDNKLWKII